MVTDMSGQVRGNPAGPDTVHAATAEDARTLMQET